MRPRAERLGRLRPRSLRARTALAAGLAAAVLFGAAAWEMRHLAYEQQMRQAVSDARTQANLLITNTTTSSWPEGDDWGKFPYELVTTHGLLSASSQLTPFESGGHAFMPLPPAARTNTPYAAEPVAHFPKTAAIRSSPLAGLNLTAVSATLPVHDLLTPQRTSSETGPGGAPADAQVRAYVFVTTGPADAAVAALDRILYPAVPAAVLLVAAVAYLATRRALRPVEQIRARTAAVTANDPRERVEVPGTGDEIARLATTINATLERLEDAARTQRSFVADAAHELRSPLASLLATLEVAEAYPQNTDWPETAETATHQARRLQALANDLLLLARLDATPGAASTGSGTPTRPVDMATLAQDLSADFAARRTGVFITADIGTTALVQGNAGQLDRMLRNLLDNAVRHAHTRVDIAVAAEGNDIQVTVQDDGPGIPVEDRERIFDRFTRLDDDRSRDTGGAGLGLPIAREIAERHHGTLHADDSPRGACFVLRLPAALPRSLSS